jgi:hypothetical protein
MRLSVVLTLVMAGAITLLSAGVSAGAAGLPADAGENIKSSNIGLSESETYIDLNTGKTFKLIYDDLNAIYNRDDLFALDLYVNNRTKDTFWLEEAITVNNALVRDAEGVFKVDPMKVKRDGNSYKVRADVGHLNQKTPKEEPKPEANNGINATQSSIQTKATTPQQAVIDPANTEHVSEQAKSAAAVIPQ